MFSILTIISNVLKLIKQTLSELTESINLRYLLQHTSLSIPDDFGTHDTTALKSTLDGFLTC